MKPSALTLLAVQRRLVVEELADLLEIVLAGAVVDDRVTAERLVSVVGGALALVERHVIDGHGRCPWCKTIPRNWCRPWHRQSFCSVYVAFLTDRIPNDHRSSE